MLSHNLLIKSDFIIFGNLGQELCSLKIVDGILKTDWFFSKGMIRERFIPKRWYSSFQQIIRSIQYVVPFRLGLQETLQ